MTRCQVAQGNQNKMAKLPRTSLIDHLRIDVMLHDYAYTRYRTPFPTIPSSNSINIQVDWSKGALKLLGSNSKSKSIH